jgi:hypothetical protein
LPDDASSGYKTTDPQDRLGKFTEPLQHRESALSSLKRLDHAFRILLNAVYFGFDSKQAVVDFTVGDVGDYVLPFKPPKAKLCFVG